MARRGGRQPVVIDTSTLINFLKVDRIDLLSNLLGYDFFVPATVQAEVIKRDQPRRLQESIDEGLLTAIKEESAEELALYVGYRDELGLGKGEATCLAVAKTRGWMVASDDRGLCRREVRRELGSARLLTTPALLVLAIRAGVLTIDEADRIKGRLGPMRLEKEFGSFREVVDPEGDD